MHIWQFKRLLRYQGEAVRNGVPTFVIFDAEFNGGTFGTIGALLDEIDSTVIILTSPDENSLFLFLFSKAVERSW